MRFSSSVHAYAMADGRCLKALVCVVFGLLEDSFNKISLAAVHGPMSPSECFVLIHHTGNR